MSERPKQHSVTLTRVLDAPIGLVYRAWTEAEHVIRWMKCDTEATLELENWVPEVGAEFTTHMVKVGVFEAQSRGRFTEVDPPRLLAYVTDPDPELRTPEMQVRVEFRELDGKTEVTLTHSGIPTEELCGVMEGGWTNSLGMLQEVL